MSQGHLLRNESADFLRRYEDVGVGKVGEKGSSLHAALGRELFSTVSG